MEEVQKLPETVTLLTVVPLWAIITIVILITTMMEHLKSHIQKIPRIARKTTPAVKSTIVRTSCNNYIQNIRKTYKTAALAITIATSMTDHTNWKNKHQTANRNTQKIPGTQKLNDEYDGLYQSHTSRTHNNNYN